MTSIKDLSKWDRRFLELATLISTWSKDPSTQVGCVIIGGSGDREIRSTGYNGFPRGVADDDRLFVRENKYPIIVHAEENAIAQAARIGVQIKGCTAYVTMQPCAKCARLLIQAGVYEVVFPKAAVPKRWREEMLLSLSLLSEAGLRVRSVDLDDA